MSDRRCVKVSDWSRGGHIYSGEAQVQVPHQRGDANFRHISTLQLFEL